MGQSIVYCSMRIGINHDAFVCIKVSGPFVETKCAFFYMKNIINAEIWA